jgi:hypothetical protein
MLISRTERSRSSSNDYPSLSDQYTSDCVPDIGKKDAGLLRRQDTLPPIQKENQPGAQTHISHR